MSKRDKFLRLADRLRSLPAATQASGSPGFDMRQNAVQAIGDGGTRPDNSTEFEVKATIVKLQNVDTEIDTRPLRDVFSSTPPNPSGEVGVNMGGYEP